MNAYELGRVMGSLLLFGAGAALLVVGSRRPRVPEERDADAPQPARRRSRLMMIAGAVLIVMSMLGQLGQEVGEEQPRDRTITLPAAVLGLDRNEAATAQAQKQATGGIRTAIYGTPPKGVLVTVTEQDSSDLGGLLAESERGAKASGMRLAESTDVDPGKLGGKARCWKAILQGTPAILCAFVDEGSILSTFDFFATTVQQSAQRGRIIREATIS